MSALRETNRKFYQFLWKQSRLVAPSRFNTWPRFQELADTAPQRLEVGPGLRPRLPLEGTNFVDISEAALAPLHQGGGHVHLASVESLPFEENSFDLVCALDIVEHVEDDSKALAELTRVARPKARLLLSVPLFMSCWTPFDDIVGHHQRYEPDAFTALLAKHGWKIDESCAYGMQPKSTALVSLGMFFLRRYPDRAFWFYNRLFMPLGLRFQKPLIFEKGWCDLSGGVDEVLCVCRQQTRSEQGTKRSL